MTYRANRAEIKRLWRSTQRHDVLVAWCSDKEIPIARGAEACAAMVGLERIARGWLTISSMCPCPFLTLPPLAWRISFFT